MREDHHNKISGLENETAVYMMQQIKSVDVKNANRVVNRDHLSKIGQDRGVPV